MFEMEKFYRKKWENFQKAVNALKLELYGMCCKVEAVRNCEEQKYQEELKDFHNALARISISVDDESFLFIIPDYFARKEYKKLKVNNVDDLNFLRLLNLVKDEVLSVEDQILPGEATSCSNHGLAYDLISAIEKVTRTWLDYMINE